MAKSRRVQHPGKILRDRMEERGISLNRLSRDARIPISGVSLLANGKRAITAETALRLAQFFGTSAELWMKLQSAYDLDLARRRVGRSIARQVIAAA